MFSAVDTVIILDETLAFLVEDIGWPRLARHNARLAISLVFQVNNCLL